MTSTKQKAASGISPDSELVERIKGLVATDGERAVAERFGIGVNTVTRLCAGLPCRRGTIELAKMRLGLAS